ncbi:hypothetical protein RF11_10059 [Thelohanellus kitauei]|uniref:Uncharacterized protein n=1 Tax=Thelohanellus kitauei TaxID=669202 RepID=A0A0C2MEU4_THEKT|nr:hypothetical protein RF11_10059 [Thelohanellus kitauei]
MNIYLINGYGDFIMAYIEELQLLNDVETKKYYTFFVSLAKDLRPLVDSRMPTDMSNCIVIFTRILSKLASKFFETYINSNYEDDFTFYSELNYIGEFNNLHNQFQKDPKDTFVVDVRANLLRSLTTVLRFVLDQHNFNDIILITRNSTSDYPRLMSCLFFIFKIKEDSHFPSYFQEVLELILNISPDAPSLLIEKLCQYLKDYIDHYNQCENYPDVAITVLDSIYKWLANKPGPAFKIFSNRRRYCHDEPDDIYSDIDVSSDLNSISIIWLPSAEIFLRSQVFPKGWAE